MPRVRAGETIADYIRRNNLEPTGIVMRHWERSTMLREQRGETAAEEMVIQDEVAENPYRPLTVVSNNAVWRTWNEGPPIVSDFTSPAPEKNSKPASDARMMVLEKATHKVNQQIQSLITELPRSAGRRETEYRSLINKEKNEYLTPQEIAYSEIPISVASVNRNKMAEIASNYVSMGRITGDGITTRFAAQCGKCQQEINTHYAFFYIGGVFCADHIPDYDMCTVCQNFNSTCKEVTTFDGTVARVCKACISNRTHCRQCSTPISSKFVLIRKCQGCIDRIEDDGTHRKFSYGIKWVGKNLGDIIKSQRMFSSEVEALTTNRDYHRVLRTLLPQEIGIDRDGSIESHKKGEYGFEVQTPRLSGSKGEELVRRLAANLKDIHATVNSSCGMHIHLDGKGIVLSSRRDYPAAMIQLLKTYIVFEDVIMSFLPFSRRQNDYCRRLSENFQLAEVENLRSVFELEKLWFRERTHNDIQRAKGSNYHSSRYFGTNFNSLLKEGHLEIRFHSGTTNARKILEWANLHALIMDACAKKLLTPELLREAQATSRIADKTTMLFEVIGLAESSKQYFRTRQKKFGDKKAEDEETVGKIKDTYTTTSNALNGLSAVVRIQMANRMSEAVDSIDVPQVDNYLFDEPEF